MSWKRTGLVLAIAVTVVGLVTCRSPAPDVPEETPDLGVIGVIDVMVEDYSFSAPPTMRSGFRGESGQMDVMAHSSSRRSRPFESHLPVRARCRHET